MFWALNDSNTCTTINCDPKGATTKQNEAKIAQYTYNVFSKSNQVCEIEAPIASDLQQALED
jgi:hypothetical protein